MVTSSLDAVGGVERDYLGNIPSSKYNSVLNSINKRNNNNSSYTSTSGLNSHQISSEDLKEKSSFDSEWRLFSEAKAKSSRAAFQ